MQIYVCVKHVPDSAANIIIVNENQIEQNIAFLLNPYDEHAVTCADQIKKDFTDTKVTAICLGPKLAEKTIRSAMAMGADDGILIVSDEKHDSISTANALHAAISQTQKPDIIFTGKEAIDTEGMQTMFRLGALFDFPVVNDAVDFKIKDNRAIVKSQIQGSLFNFYAISMPCVIGAGRDLNTPAYPTFPQIVKARKKIIKNIDLSDLNLSDTLGSGTKTIKLEPLLLNRSPKEIQGTPNQIASKIIQILKEEAKVI